MVPKKNNSVSILGCGWLGLPLAEQLVKLGYQVKGSTTTPDKLLILHQKQIQPYKINLAELSVSENLVDFLNSDYLVISFPPRIRSGGGESYLEQIKFLCRMLQQAPKVKQVLFISSTSVYEEVNGVITEEGQHVLNTDSPLLQAEVLLQQSAIYKTIILRFGGLVGGTRHPGRFLAGKTDVPQPDAPVNLLHLDDCIGICVRIISGPIRNDVFHAAADEHPTRAQFYPAAAKALQLPPPQFKSEEKLASKIIDSSKVKAAYNYQFIHPDPMLFF